MTIAMFSNRYAIEREIARGGMADVYVGHDELLDRRVAVKVLFAEFARDPSFVERFRREAQSAAGLNHPNIVAVYDWGQESGTYFIVMEYVEGRVLRDIMRTEGALAPAQAAGIAAEIAGALAYAHRHGVVHRDVKPGNVLITPSGQVKVTDFGIARAGVGESLTQTGAVMGTAAYFSPEQAQGLPVDGRSDVYSLGVVLYEMVTGVPPFSGDTPVAVAYKHVREDPMSPTDRNPDLPPDLDRIIRTAMAKSPGDRYQSADDLRADLQRFLRGQPVAGGPVTGVLTDVPTTAVGAAAAPTRAVAAVEPTLPPRHTGTRRWPAFVVTAILAAALIAGIGYLIFKTTTDEKRAEGTAVIPSVVGLTVSDAKRELQQAGFDNIKVRRAANEKIAEGLVAKTIPDVGTRQDKSDPVELVVSSGPADVEVPDVSGLTAEEAQPIIEGAGFEYAFTIEYSATVLSGRAIRTIPAAGTEAAPKSKVTVVYSVGDEPATVPDVAGLDLDAATAQLTANDFRSTTRSEPSDTVPAGKVIRTEPAGNEKAPRNSTVVIVVSTGPEQATVPNVVGETESSARSLLTGAGFQVSVTYVPVSPANVGKVITQSPSGGSSAAKSSTVTLTVGEGSTPTTPTT